MSRRTERVALRSSPCRARHGAARRSAHGARAAGRARTRASSPPAGRGPRRPATRRWRRPCPGRTSTPRSLRRRARRPSWRGPSVAHRSHTRSRSIVRRRCKGRRHAGASCDRPFRRGATPAPRTRGRSSSRYRPPAASCGRARRRPPTPVGVLRCSHLPATITHDYDDYRGSDNASIGSCMALRAARPLSPALERFGLVDPRRIVTTAEMDKLTHQARAMRSTKARSVPGKNRW